MISGYLMKDFYNVALIAILIYKGGGWVVDEYPREMGCEEGHGGLMKLVIVGKALFDVYQTNGEGVLPSTTGMV